MGGYVRHLAPGDWFAGYRIESLAGAGGMGLVYRAWQSRPERLVAVKVIKPELADNDEFRARFQHESAVAAEIEHPNVIPIYAVDEKEGLLFIAMRFVDGVDLGALRSRYGRFEPEHAARLVSQIAGALDAAHSRGLVHRDVKPTNVLVADESPDEHLYLTDFGLTKRIADSGGLTAPGVFVGTLDYIAPEQLHGNHVDARGDVYALGCVLYELLSGVVPFPREDERAKPFAHIADYAPAPSALVPDIPVELDRVVARAMAKEPQERYLSAGDLARAAVAAAAGRVDGAFGGSVATGTAATVIAATSSPGATGPERPDLATMEGSAASLDDLVSQVAEVIAPLLSGAEGPRPHGATGGEGLSGHNVPTRILGKLRRYVTSGSEPGVSELRVALRAALADGELIEDDLATLVSLGQPAGKTVNRVGSVRAKNVFTGNQIDVGGDFLA